MAEKSKITTDDLTDSRKKTDAEYVEAKHNLRDTYDYEFKLSGENFWYWAQFAQTEDEDCGEVRPFPVNFDYLHEFKHDMDNNQKVILLKSRRLMASWMMILDQLHGAMFTGTGIADTYDVFRGALMSIGQTEAEYLMQRATKVYHRLPDWMKERAPMVKDNVMYLEFAGGGIIQAFPLKREGPQTFGFTKVGFDEMALQEAVRTVWTGLLPTLGAKGKLLAVSTPNGKGNLFADIWFNKDNQYPGIFRKKIHWKAHPEHDEAWYKKTTDGMNSQMRARMFELSFSAYFGQSVWGNFNHQMHTAEEGASFTDGSTAYVGWDLGYHFPAMSLWQRNTKDQWVGISELQGYDVSFDTFCMMVIDHLETIYDRSKTPEIHCVPPDAKSPYRMRSKTGSITDIAEIKTNFRVGNRKAQIRMGAKDVGTRSNEAPRMKETRKTFNLRADGQSGMYVDPETMPLFLEGCAGGYAYPEKGGEKPIDNEYAHLQDSYQAVVTAYNKMHKIKDKGKTARRPRSVKNDPLRTGLPPRR